jgi:hypothetical protein
MHKANPMDEVRGFKEVMTYKRPLTKIDSSEAITVPSLWLKVDEMATGNQPWKDSREMTSWQGFE